MFDISHYLSIKHYQALPNSLYLSVKAFVLVLVIKYFKSTYT